MTTKILINNGQVLHRLMYRLLTPDEFSDQEGQIAQEQSMANVHETLGSWVLPRDLAGFELYYTPQYEPY